MALIETTKGMMEEDKLVKKAYSRQAPSGLMEITEYWLDGELVHRSVTFTPNKKALEQLGG